MASEALQKAYPAPFKALMGHLMKPNDGYIAGLVAYLKSPAAKNEVNNEIGHLEPSLKSDRQIGLSEALEKAEEVRVMATQLVN